MRKRKQNYDFLEIRVVFSVEMVLALRRIINTFAREKQ